MGVTLDRRAACALASEGAVDIDVKKGHWKQYRQESATGIRQAPRVACYALVTTRTMRVGWTELENNLVVLV
jgi:hypothetical protein